MSLRNFLDKLNVVNPEEINIRLDEEKSSLILRHNDITYNNVIPERPFPISHPEFVILKDSRNLDICIIKDITKVNTESRKSLEKLLDILYYIPKIRKIIKLETGGDKFEWETETSRGKRRFTTQGTRSIIFLENRIVITDTDSNIYQIENIDVLDEKSKKVIQSNF
jgi:hypothetical protein